MARPTSPSVSVYRRRPAGGERECTVLWVGGEHDIATKVTLAVAIARAAQRDDAPLLIDLSAVTFLDASTVGAIVGSRNRLRLRGRSLELRAPSPPALRVLYLCGLTDLIRRECVQPADPAAALASWVDVPPLEPAGRTDHEDRRIMASAGTPPGPVPAAAGGESEEAAATVGVARGGP